MNKETCNLRESSIDGRIDFLLLAGGKGKRLKDSGIVDKPKPLVDIYIDGKTIPMIDYAIGNIEQNRRFNINILTSMDPESRSNLVEDYIVKKYNGRFSFSREEFPLGTAGAVYNALINRNSILSVVSPCDTLFPFGDIESIIETHLNRKSKTTWVLTSNPGNNAQNSGKILVDKFDGRVIYSAENEIGLQKNIDNSVQMTSSGVVILTRDYFIDWFSRNFDNNSGLPVDLYREYLPKLLDCGETVDSYDVKKPSQDLGTLERLEIFGRGK